MTSSIAAQSGTFTIGGELAVHRLGYGSMQLTGPGTWGDPDDPDEAVRVLRRSIELGVTLIDTADSYGPDVAELLIRRALHPYPDGLVIATKAGQVRPGPDQWTPLGRPAYLRQQVEMSLRNLGVEQIGLFQLHRIDPQVPLEDQVGQLARLQQEGKIGHIGLSEITVEQLKAAQQIATIATVQNRYNVRERRAEPLLDYCTEQGIGFIPWYPLATGGLVKPDGRLSTVAQRTGHTPAQLALAWLLHRSPVMLPIPGTASVAHLEENTAAAAIQLSTKDADEVATAAAS